ncbi:hypothetical protein F4803DRAFT_545016 [Xylaria telfairii]|nr:hypothetical protein F4803DRAFT_545016 [Xylaria telfairii]
MSGFEVAGVVLGVIPLIISSLEHYQAGKGLAASIVKWRGLLSKLIGRLRLQRTFFYLEMLQLLRAAAIEEVIENYDVTEEEFVLILRNVKHADEIKEYLGPLYGTFLEILGAYEKCLKALASKLGHIHRLPESRGDDLEAILAANPPSGGKFAFKNRLSFAIHYSALRELVEDLSEDRLSLKIIIKGMKTQQDYAAKSPTGDSKRFAKIFARVQRNATPLYLAINDRCACKCSNSHKILMRLDNRIPLQKAKPKLGRKIMEHTNFNLVLDLEEDLQEVHVNVSQSPSCDADGQAACQHGPTVKLPSITFNTTNSKEKCVASTDIINICSQASHARISKHILELELTDRVLSLTNGIPSPRQEFCQPKSLQDILRDGTLNEDSRLTPKQRTLLALDLSASILQLRDTLWFRAPFDSSTVRFLACSTSGDSQRQTVTGPFIERILGNSCANGISSSSTEKELDPKTTLLELAILLLEIWHHRPLEMWIEKAGIESVETTEARRIAAIRWVEKTSEHLPPHHLTAIEQCLAVCSGRLRRWQDVEFVQQCCENIIKPLYESCKAW